MTMTAITVELADGVYAGSDNSWRFRFYAPDSNMTCKTNWLDRPGVNDWEAGSIATWADKEFASQYLGTCSSQFRISASSPSLTLNAELLGYYDRDDVNVRRVSAVLSTSGAWLGGGDLVYESAVEVGWTTTNKETYEDGGAHIKIALRLKDAASHLCKCRKLALKVANKVEGLEIDGHYDLISGELAYKHLKKRVEIYYFRKKSFSGWVIGRSRLSGSGKDVQLYHKSRIESRDICVDRLNSDVWRVRKKNEDANIKLRCLISH